MGYNNAVYLINKACKVLYSGKQGTARSVNIEDLEEHYSTIGKEIKSNYKSGTTQYGAPVRYTGTNVYYPIIAKEEKGMGIDSEIYTADDGNTYNTLNNSGIGASDEGNAPYVGTETKGSSYDQVSTKGITVTQTYYELSAASSINECYEKDVYYSLFHGATTYYWLASRCMSAPSGNGYCSFYVGYVYKDVGGYSMFRSFNDSLSRIRYLRPIVELTSNVQAEYVGASSNSGYNTWNIK